MERGTLVLRQSIEGATDLRQPNRVLLRWVETFLEQISSFALTPTLRARPAQSIDKGVVQDGDKPGQKT